MVETMNRDLPNWFLKDYLFSHSLDQIDNKKFLWQLSLASIWFTMAIISLTATDGSVTRTVVSFGYEILGEYAYKIGNLCNVFFMIQYVITQLIQYQTFRLSNMETENLVQPLRSAIGMGQFWDKLLRLVDIVVILAATGCAGFSAYVIYGIDWFMVC